MTSFTDQPVRPAHLYGHWSGDHTMLTSMTPAVHLWREPRRAYQELAALDDRLLEDIGLCRHELAEHCARFWR
ncbi:DUF1127 domain-containing protein [Methylobacterium soli]|uniref:DUF1127 domain-containing protein n=1 Tax=Methylobacterium soli TaxID=553447 RepID=UPI001EE1892F|nr:DUF1127 domain-containing protein [Methylobacterium soli]